MPQPADRPVGDRRAPSRGDLQRARLINAVIELLATTSIAEMSVMQIAKQAEVTRPVFYFYFESKYAVLAAALNQVWAEFDAVRVLTNGVDVSGPPQEITRRLTRDAIEVWRRHDALLVAVIEARSSDEQLAQMWDELTGRTRRQVCQLIEVLRAGGLARPASDDLPRLVDALFGMTTWAMLDGAVRGDDEALQQTVEVISSVWVAAVWGVQTEPEVAPARSRRKSR